MEFVTNFHVFDRAPKGIAITPSGATKNIFLHYVHSISLSKYV